MGESEQQGSQPLTAASIRAAVSKLNSQSLIDVAQIEQRVFTGFIGKYMDTMITWGGETRRPWVDKLQKEIQDAINKIG